MFEPTPPSRLVPFYFEDLQPGQRFVSGTHVIDVPQIIAFASQFDPQPFHTDPVAAQNSFFHGLVASGWHTAAVSMRLLVQSGLEIAGGMIGAGVEINWPRPTQPDSTVHVEVEVLELRTSKSRPDRGIVTIRANTINQLSEIVQVMTCKLIVPRRTPESL